MSMLEVRGLAVGYGKVAVLRDARLDVGSGRIVTVIGPNGAGKTTLLAALMGLLPARGSVRYDGGESRRSFGRGARKARHESRS